MEGTTRSAQPRVQICPQSPLTGTVPQLVNCCPLGPRWAFGGEALSVSELRPAQGRCPTDDAQDKDGDDGIRLEEGVEARKAIQISEMLEGEEMG